MLRLLLVLLSSFSCLFLSAQSEPPFRVVFWNTENLFDTRHDSLKNDMEFLPQSIHHWNYRRYKKKLDNIARTLIAVGEWNFPALIGFCEVENDIVMRDLTLYSPLKEAGYRYVMTHCPDLRGINVAFMYQRDRFKLLSYSSLPIGKFKDHRPTRDILHVSGLLLTGDTLDIMVAHLPSRSGGARQSEPYRLYAAQKLKNAADSLFRARPSAKLIIMGDFNDHPTDKSIVQVLQALPPEATPHHHRLYHLLANKAKDRNFGSYKYQGEWGVLDHLIVSGSLLDASGTLFTEEKRANVVRLPFLLTKDEKYGGMQPFRTYYGMKYQEGYSDHLPVYVDFETNQDEY